MDGTTWRREILAEMSMQGESWDDVEYVITEHDDDLDVEFDPTYGAPEGPRFTLWTKSRVYFPVEYDGSESVKSAPRNPCDEPMEHI